MRNACDLIGHLIVKLCSISFGYSAGIGACFAPASSIGNSLNPG
jgi:hypothetical protein